MDRAALKTKAKELIKGNKWYIWKPMIMLTLVAFVIAFIGGFLDALLGFMKEETVEVLGVKTTSYSLGPITSILSFVLSVFEAAFTVWYAKFLIDFTHGVKTEFSFKAIIEFFKKHWLLCWVVSLLVGLNIGIGFILLIVPGIMATFGLMFYAYVQSEDPTVGVTDVLKKTWALTKGHKMELFVLTLSFIGWEILAGLTLGILYIWLMPYMVVTFTLAYESLKGTTK